MAAVVNHRPAGMLVLDGHQALGPGELGRLRVLVRGARNRADHDGRALDLDAVQLVVVLPRVDHRRHLGVALDIGPPLAAGQRVDPQGAAVPDEPDRRDVRAARPGRRQPAGPLLAEEGIPFLRAHRDHPTAPLLSHRTPSVRGDTMISGGPSGGAGGRACRWADRAPRPRSWCGWCGCSARRPSRPRRPPQPAWWSALPRRWPAGRCWWSHPGRDRYTHQVPGTSMACTRRPTNSGGYAPTPASAMNPAAASGWRIHCSACRSVAISCRIITSAWSSRAR